MTERIEFGDWQTPISLARAALTRVAQLGVRPAAVVEPTCGTGSFLIAAAETYAEAALYGYDINASYVREASERLSRRAHVRVANFFELPWERELSRLPEPLLVVGNPPWVTSAVLGALGSSNAPSKSNFKGLRGYDARTGKSNFDISEWMLLRMIEAVGARQATFAVLCKAAVARRVLAFAKNNICPGGLWRIDALAHFGAAVDAVLFVFNTGNRRARWPVFVSLEAKRPETFVDVIDGVLTSDGDKFTRTAHLIGRSDPEWRSGIKHDCARVMELTVAGTSWVNGDGKVADIESNVVYPLLKSSDVANGNDEPRRSVVVPQRSIGEDTRELRRSAPKAWKYLHAHRDLLSARKSSIYRGRPEFSVFGVGPYSFAPWKIAVSGLYKRCTFTLVGPQGGRPVMLDDTCYFLPFASEAEARAALLALRSQLAADFFEARIFWDAKRPIKKEVLQQLNLAALVGRRIRS